MTVDEYFQRVAAGLVPVPRSPAREPLKPSRESEADRLKRYLRVGEPEGTKTDFVQPTGVLAPYLR